MKICKNLYVQNFFEEHNVLIYLMMCGFTQSYRADSKHWLDVG